eukprot:15449940-Alexandrium_andersonii.AAC.1
MCIRDRVAVWRPPRLASRTCGSEPAGCESEPSGQTVAGIASELRVERPFRFTVPCESGLRVEIASDVRVESRTSVGEICAVLLAASDGDDEKHPRRPKIAEKHAFRTPAPG